MNELMKDGKDKTGPSTDSGSDTKNEQTAALDNHSRLLNIIHIE